VRGGCVVFYVNLLDVSSNITKVGGNFMDTGFYYFHLLKLKNILLVLCLSLICELGFSQIKMKVIDVPTRSGVTNRIIFLATPEPKATLITGGKFPAPWGVTLFLGDERIHTQEPQRDGADVPHGVSCEVSKSGI
jgi:hypothetical protein